jgi:hypothetical protein
VGLVEHGGGLDAVGEVLPGRDDGAEGRVDRPRADGGEGIVGEKRVTTSRSIPGWVRWKAQQTRGGEPAADHVDAQRSAPGTHGGRGALRGLQELTAVGLLGPMATAVANALGHVLSAAGLAAIGGREPRPAHAARPRARDLLDGGRHILGHAGLRPLFLNTVLVNGLVLATAPLMAVLMLDRLGFPPWQYGLAFGAPCVGGLVGARLARPLVARFGQDRVLRTTGALRACWSLGWCSSAPDPPGCCWSSPCSSAWSPAWACSTPCSPPGGWR